MTSREGPSAGRFSDLLQSRLSRDPAFSLAVLCESIDTMLAGDVDTGKAILRAYIEATVGFEKLGESTDTPPKNLIRMFGPRGNPQARKLFRIIGYLQKQADVELHVAAGPTEKVSTMGKKNPHWGTTLDQFLTEQGFQKTARAEAAARSADLHLVPNAKTVAAMKAARRGKVVKVGTPAKLLASLKVGE